MYGEKYRKVVAFEEDSLGKCTAFFENEENILYLNRNGGYVSACFS